MKTHYTLLNMLVFGRNPAFCVVVFATIFLATGCDPSPKDRLETVIRDALKDDKGIDQAEYAQISSLIKGEPDLQDLLPDSGSIQVFINKHAEKMSKSGRPRIKYPIVINTGANQPPRKKTVYQIFYENSASMDGYLNGQTEFNDDFLTLLTTIKLKNYGLELFYVNNEVHQVNHFLNELQDYLKPDNVKKFGDRGNSEINRLLEIVADSICKYDHKVALVVSDYIYSIKGNKVVAQLNLQKNTTALGLSKLPKKDFAVLLIKLNSKFKGMYYTMENTDVYIEEERPVYIWVMGPRAEVCSFSKTFRIPELSGYSNQLTLLNEPQGAPPFCTILNSTNKKGNFRSAKRGQNTEYTSISDVSPDRNGIFQFSLALDLSSFPIDGAYVKDLKNYSVVSDQGDEFSVTAVDTILGIKSNDKKQKGEANYILTITNTSGKITKGEHKVSLSLKKLVPNWVEECSTETDISPLDRKNKTFGFSYLVNGIKMAYGYNEESLYFKIPLLIKN